MAKRVMSRKIGFEPVLTSDKEHCTVLTSGEEHCTVRTDDQGGRLDKGKGVGGAL